jgi:hypothetical protein
VNFSIEVWEPKGDFKVGYGKDWLLEMTWNGIKL